MVEWKRKLRNNRKEYGNKNVWERFVCARYRNFPISGTVVLEYKMCGSGLYVRDIETSQYLVLWYWNIKMCGSGLYVRDTETSQYLVLWYWNIQMCGSGLYVRDTETSQYLVLWYWNIQNKWENFGKKLR